MLRGGGGLRNFRKAKSRHDTKRFGSTALAEALRDCLFLLSLPKLKQNFQLILLNNKIKKLNNNYK